MSAAASLTEKQILALPAKVLRLPKLLTDEETAKREGTLPTIKDVPLILTENTDVFCAETGQCLLRFRKAVLPVPKMNTAYTALVKAGKMESDNRGMAAGPLTKRDMEMVRKREGGKGFVQKGTHRYHLIGKDGHTSNVTMAKRTRGGIVGFFGKSSRQPYCRLTAYTQQNFASFRAAFPAVREVDKAYRALMPEHYARQKAAVEASSQDFVIEGTAFSTTTVNHNFPTACHYDAGDYEQGFGNLCVVRRGHYTGCCTSFPQYGVGVDMHTGDVLLMDVHKLHGNTPMVGSDAKAERLALVMYFREDIQACGTMQQELSKARQRRDI